MRIPILGSRTTAIAIGVALTALIVFIGCGPVWAIAAFPLLGDGAMTVAWILAAAGIGWPVVAMLLPESKSQPLLFFVSATAVGMGLMSLIVLALGLAGWLNRATALTVVIGGLLAVIPVLWTRRNAIESWLGEPAGFGWMWLAAVLPAGVTILCALLPSGVLWGDEPNGYDVVEYHMQIPREWYDAHKITPLKHNVFSFFPQGVEMHYLLAMELEDGPWNAMYLAQFMHAAMCALSVAAICGAAGTWAGLIVAATPWITLLAPIAYVEGGVLLYGSLALVWAMRAGGWRTMMLAGAMAGFAAGVKLTNVPMLLAAIPIAAALARPRGSIKNTAAFLAAGLIVFAPWLIRTAIWTGNPIFPEGMSYFGRAHFSLIQAERWRLAYLPTTGRLAALFQQIIADGRYGYVLIPAAVISATVDWRRPQTRFLISMLLIVLIIWLGFTHLQSRFFILAIPICALLIAQTEGRVWATGLIGVLLACGTLQVGRRLARYQRLGAVQILGIENLAAFTPPELQRLRPDIRIDLVGNAAAFWYQVSMSELRYRTVFDVDSSDPNRSIVEDWLAGSEARQPNRVIVVDRNELNRFSRTYFGIPPLTDEEINRLSQRDDVLIMPEH